MAANGYITGLTAAPGTGYGLGQTSITTNGTITAGGSLYYNPGVLTISHPTPASSGPIHVKHLDVRRTMQLELENAPHPVSAHEDEDGVRWVQIGCQRMTLARWKERGSRIIAANYRNSTAEERTRLAKGLKETLAAIEKAFR